MRLVLKNIGMLKNAEINIKSLSIIAGENDQGKSTVGKVVFCIIKAMSRYKEDLQESKEYKLNERLERSYFTLRRSIRPDNVEEPELFSLLHDIADSQLKIEARIAYFKDIINILKHTPDFDKPQLEALESQVLELHDLFKEPKNIKRSIENALSKVFASEFDSSILQNGEEEGFIQLYDGNAKLIDIKVSVDNRVKLLNDVDKIEIKDATFIETPLILNNHDLLIRSQAGLNIKRANLSRLGIPYTTLHTKDLFDKIVSLPIDDLTDVFGFGNDDQNTIFQKQINDIVNGSIEYDREKRSFVFKREEEQVSIKNTASGIKVFGILQLLSSNGFIKNNSILIFDEPENHLHPKWQLDLAKTLVNLAKSGVSILVSSHSPYMIEALKRYSENVELENETGFYLAENRSIENRDRLEEIFTKLAEPFETFRNMDEELLKDE